MYLQQIAYLTYFTNDATIGGGRLPELDTEEGFLQASSGRDISNHEFRHSNFRLVNIRSVVERALTENRDPKPELYEERNKFRGTGTKTNHTLDEF